MILSLVCCFLNWPDGREFGWHAYGGFGLSLLQFVLFALLGWNVYGPAIKG